MNNYFLIAHILNNEYNFLYVQMTKNCGKHEMPSHSYTWI